MTIPSSLQSEDRDRQFDDWGESITFRHFTITVDPQTQQSTENQIDTSLTAIRGDSTSRPETAAATRQLRDGITFLIKAEELPTTDPEPNSRVVFGGDEYDVTDFTLSQDGLVYTLSCRKRV